MEDVPKPKSYRFAYISVICMDVIYDFVGVVVVWSHLPHADHHQNAKTNLTFLTCCLLQQGWNGQEKAMNLCDDLLSPKSAITISVGM